VVSEFQKVLFLVRSAVQVNGAARCNRPKGLQQIKRSTASSPQGHTLCVGEIQGRIGHSCMVNYRSEQIVEFTVISHHRDRQQE